MTKRLMSRSCRPLMLTATAAVEAGVVGLPRQADVRAWIGFGFPRFVSPPVYYPAPVYCPQPTHYPPPPYYAPPPYQPPANYNPPAPSLQSGRSCVAAPSACRMDGPVAPGGARYCTTQEGRVWGRAT